MGSPKNEVAEDSINRFGCYTSEQTESHPITPYISPFALHGSWCAAADLVLQVARTILIFSLVSLTLYQLHLILAIEFHSSTMVWSINSASSFLILLSFYSFYLISHFIVSRLPSLYSILLPLTSEHAHTYIRFVNLGLWGSYISESLGLCLALGWTWTFSCPYR